MFELDAFLMSRARVQPSPCPGYSSLSYSKSSSDIRSMKILNSQTISCHQTPLTSLEFEDYPDAIAKPINLRPRTV
eukprot:6181809-Pleurochrysis_carterae.AAC.2